MRRVDRIVILICAMYNQLHAFSLSYDNDTNMDNMRQAEKILKHLQRKIWKEK